MSNADDIDDANVRQHARSGPPVNRSGADAELFGDLVRAVGLGKSHSERDELTAAEPQKQSCGEQSPLRR